MNPLAEEKRSKRAPAGAGIAAVMGLRESPRRRLHPLPKNAKTQLWRFFGTPGEHPVTSIRMYTVHLPDYIRYK